MPDRVLILANAVITNARESLPESLRSDRRRARELMVVAPRLTTRLQTLCSDIDDAHHAAEQRLHHIATDMSAFRTPPLTSVGDENQLQAVADALTSFDADACVVITHTREQANYHEHGVPQLIHEHFRLPTTTLTVNTYGRIVEHHTTSD
jgi:hypothetical protein